MPTIQTFDELNELRKKDSSIEPWSRPFARYFGEMKLSKEQKKERIALAEDIEDVVTFFFVMVMLQSDYSYMSAIDSIEAKEDFRNRMREVVEKHTELNSDMVFQINEYVDDVSDTTFEHLVIINSLTQSKDRDKREKERRYISEDRARLLAEEESNSIFNTSDFYKAKRLGYTKKRWNTMRDRHVRRDHERLEGKEIPIDSLFEVGTSLMRYPRDTMYSPNPKQVVNCRCTVTYTKSNN